MIISFLKSGGILLLAVLLCIASFPLLPAAAQGGTQLEFGQPVEGALDDVTFRVVYAFTAAADEVISLSMTRIEGDLDPYLLLMDTAGTILAASDDGGDGRNALIPLLRVPVEGRFFVIATRFGQEHGSTTGTYRLLLERLGESSPDGAALQYGDSVVGRITQAVPYVFYFIRAQRGDVINVSMRRTSGNLDPHLDLATAEGLILVANDDDPLAEGTLDAAIRRYTVQESGVLLVVATRFGREAGDTEGSYVLTISRIPTDELGLTADDARLIDYGQALEGDLDGDIPARYFRFDAQRGDVITATLTRQAGNLDPVVQLLDADLTELARDDNGGDGVNARLPAFTLPAAGTYYLVAQRGGQTTGTFELQLNGRAGIVGGRALEIMYGASVSGMLGDEVSAEEYVFFGEQGDVISIDMERVSDDLDALVTLYDSDRKQIAFDDDGGGDQNARIARFELPRDDMYILVASRFERELGTTRGAYILTLELVQSGR